MVRTQLGDQVALLSAARLYQDAIWIADADPSLAWLLLVSAIEAAAERSDRSKSSATDWLRESKPALVKAIQEHCPDLLKIVADEIADSIGATRKFVEFVLRFLPRPPLNRPGMGFQIHWEKRDLKKSPRKIYDYRSKALHTGVPWAILALATPARCSFRI